MPESDRRRFNQAFAQALERVLARTGKTQKELATEIADEQVRARRLLPGADRRQERAKAAGQWQKRLSAWKRDRLPQDVGELRLALGVVDPDGNVKTWITQWMAARRDRSSFGLSTPEREQPASPVPTTMPGGLEGLAHAVAHWREPHAGDPDRPQPDGEPDRRHKPAYTDRWRLTSTAVSSSLTRLHNYQMPRPGKITDSNTEQQQPAVRIGIVLACDPLHPGQMPRPQRQEQLLAFLHGSAVGQLVGELTCVEDGMAWRSCGSHGPDHLGAALIVDTSEVVPAASVWLNLPRPESPQLMSDGRCAELILEIRPRTHGGVIAPPASPAAWDRHLARALALPGALASFLGHGLNTTTYDDPATEIGIWMTAHGDLAQLVDVEGIPAEVGTQRGSWFNRYAIADPAGHSIADTVRAYLQDLADDLHLCDHQGFVGQATAATSARARGQRPHAKIKGAVALPTPPPTPGTGQAPRGWRVGGYTENFGDTPVEDVQVRLVNRAGQELPTPALYRPLLNPGDRWDFFWSVGWPFAPPPRNDQAAAAGQQHGPLPIPQEINQPLERLNLVITFTAEGQTWAQLGGAVAVATAPAVLRSSEEAYSRALEYLDGRTAADLDEVRRVVADNLVRAVQTALIERLGPGLGVEPSFRDAIHALLGNPDAWSIGSGLDDQSPQALARLAGALTQLDGHILRVAEHAAAPGRADYLRTFAEQACATLTTLAGLTYAPPRPAGTAVVLPAGALPKPATQVVQEELDRRARREGRSL